MRKVFFLMLKDWKSRLVQFRLKLKIDEKYPLWPVNEIDNRFEVNFIVNDWDINWTNKKNFKKG